MCKQRVQFLQATIYGAGICVSPDKKKSISYGIASDEILKTLSNVYFTESHCICVPEQSKSEFQGCIHKSALEEDYLLFWRNLEKN